MVETIVFVKALGVTVLFLALMGGLFYWVLVLLHKKYPNMKYWMKYKLFRKKFNEEDVKMLLEDAEQGIDDKELLQALILSNKVTPERSKELLYIYGEIKTKLKGGIKNE